MKVFISLLLLLLIAARIDAAQDACGFNDRKHSEHQEFPIQCPPEWLSLAARPINSRATFAEKLAADVELAPFLDTISQELYALRNRRKFSESPCQKDTEDLVEMARTAHNKKLAFGFGCSSECLVNVGDFNITTTVINTAEGPTNTTTSLEDPQRSERLFNAISKFEGKLKEYGTEVLKGYGMDWPRLFSMNFHQVAEEDSMRTCNVSDILAYHIDGQFSIAASLTNGSIYKNRPDGSRFDFSEFLSFSNISGKLLSAPKNIRLKRCTEEPWRELPVTNSTGVLEIYGGRSATSHFKTVRTIDNPVVQAALERGNAEKELVRDARMASNAAILIVPACLAFIPLSLFHEVDAGMALLYAVLTDVVTVIPLAIKGIELIYLGGKTTWATQAYVYGMEQPDKGGTVELWVVSCNLDPRIRQTGIVFLCLAMGLIVIGLVLEVFFAFLLVRLRNSWDDSEHVFPIRKRTAGCVWYWRHHWRYARPIYQTPIERL